MMRAVVPKKQKDHKRQSLPSLITKEQLSKYFESMQREFKSIRLEFPEDAA